MPRRCRASCPRGRRRTRSSTRSRTAAARRWCSSPARRPSRPGAAPPLRPADGAVTQTVALVHRALDPMRAARFGRVVQLAQSPAVADETRPVGAARPARGGDRTAPRALRRDREHGRHGRDRRWPAPGPGPRGLRRHPRPPRRDAGGGRRVRRLPGERRRLLRHRPGPVGRRRHDGAAAARSTRTAHPCRMRGSSHACTPSATKLASTIRNVASSTIAWARSTSRLTSARSM